jgi:ribonucleoside-diphosphate reductase alpha chain
MNREFRTEFGADIFTHKYKHERAETWAELSRTLIEEVCKGIIPDAEVERLVQYHTEMKFIAGGRYLYYAGRQNSYYNNCFLLKSLEDSKEDWANLSWKAEMCLATGGGIGNDYSIYRPKGTVIKKTGGKASGPISKMKMINEIGREIMQGGSRRSAIYASLNWKHPDAGEFLHCKDWHSIPVSGAYDENGKQLTVGYLKEKDFNYPAPLDMTNISLNYDNDFLEEVFGLPIAEIKRNFELGVQMEVVKVPITFLENVRQALKTGEPGFSFNFFSKVLETLRNASL